MGSEFLTDMMEENERLNTEKGDFLSNFVKMPEGQGVVVVRLLPPAVAGMFDRKKNPFFVPTRTHRLSGRSYHCLNELEGGRWKGNCPVCSHYRSLWKQSDKAGVSESEKERLQAEARSIKPIERYYYNVIVRKQMGENGEIEENVGPKILSIGKTLHQMIVRGIVGDKELQEEPLGDVTHITTGRDFKIVKQLRQSGGESYPYYSESKFLASASPLGDPEQIEKWLAELHDLTSLRKLLPAEEIKRQLAIHLGLIPDDSEETGFDPSEFQKDNNTVKSSSVVVTKEETETADEVEVATSSSNSGESEESLADDDFLNDLKNM